MIPIITFKQKLKLISFFVGIFVFSFIASNFVLAAKEGKLDLKTGVNSLPRTRSDFLSMLGKLKTNTLKGYIVQSGSMEPTIKVGSIVFSWPRTTYGSGDVITFASKPGSKSLVTHRVVSREYPEGLNSPPIYRTSGDANEEVDPEPVKHEQIVGKVVLSVPYLGYVANYAKQPYGFILLVIVPATIVIYEELKNLFGGVFGGLKLAFVKFMERKKKPHGEGEPPGKFNVSADDSKKHFWGKKELIAKSAVLLPIFGCFLFFTGIVSAYLSDREDSMENVLQAGIWDGATGLSGTPTPTTSVTPSPSLAKTASLYNSNEFTCEAGASATGGSTFGSASFEISGSNLLVDVQITGGTPNSVYDIWVNQDPGGCPLSSPSFSAEILTDSSGNGSSENLTVALVSDATNFWISAVDINQVLRTTAVQLP